MVTGRMRIGAKNSVSRVSNSISLGVSIYSVVKILLGGPEGRFQGEPGVGLYKTICFYGPYL
jgi:hypothetical protein